MEARALSKAGGVSAVPFYVQLKPLAARVYLDLDSRRDERLERLQWLKKQVKRILPNRGIAAPPSDWFTHIGLEGWESTEVRRLRYLGLKIGMNFPKSENLGEWFLYVGLVRSPAPEGVSSAIFEAHPLPKEV
jgi:hypothetical protein